MRVLDIIHGTTVDGVGFRTSIYFAGCKHHCKGCHNPESWDLGGGKEMSVESILKELEGEEMFGVTFSGGDPLFQKDIVELAKSIKDTGRTIWLYTGFEFESIKSHPVFEYVDIVVDGRFVEEKKEDDLLFRGSSNQRIIDVQKTRKAGNVVLWERKGFL